MATLTIKPLTEAGTSALQACISEEQAEIKKRSIRERMIFDKIWTRWILHCPFRYEWIQNPDSFRFVGDLSEKAMREMNQAMQANGVTKGTDYFIEVTR